MPPCVRTGPINASVTVPASPDHRTRPASEHRVHATVFALTDVGRTREHNEDDFVVADLESGAALDFAAGPCTITAARHGLLFTVADGMGGAASGELASSMATALILDGLRNRWSAMEPTAEGFAESLRDATIATNLRIHQHAREHPEHRGMGTTATIAGLLDDHLYLVQVGDSRAYLVRDGTAQQLTKDQSLMQRLVDAGEMTPEEAERSERRNIILQALGPEPHVTVDLTHQQVRKGDVLILCSDGLSGQVRTDEIGYVATQSRDVRAICQQLVDRANARGGPDNITVVAVRFDGDTLAPSGDGDTVGYTTYPLAGTLNDVMQQRVSTPRSNASVLKSDPTPRAGTPMPTPEQIAAEQQRRATARAAAASPAAGVPRVPTPPRAPMVEPTVETAPGVPPAVVEERHERAQPIYLVLGLVAAAAAAWMLWSLVGR